MTPKKKASKKGRKGAASKQAPPPATPAPDPGKSVEKSARPANQFQPGEDPRRGRGPEPGAPNAGRPPSVVRAAARQGFEEGIPILVRIALEGINPVRLSPDDPELPLVVKAAERIKAIETLGKFGIGVATVQLDSEGRDVLPPAVALPPKGST